MILKKRLRAIKHKLVRGWTNFALHAKFQAGHTDCTQFVILGRGRTGSNFLRSLLNAHPQVVAFGELFENQQKIGWGLPGYSQSSKTQHLFLTDPVEFLETKIFGLHPRSVKTVGFKLFYYHAQDSQWASLWKYLHSQRDVRILHVKRKNILRTHLSLKKAFITKEWVSTSKSRRDLSISLDYDDCLQAFETTRAWENEYDRFFQVHKTLEIFYEDLAHDDAHEMGRVEEFLGLAHVPVQTSMRKQATLPLSKAISNYVELKEKFRDSPWEVFFVE